MPSGPKFRCRYPATEHALPAATLTPISIPTWGSTHVTITIKNTGANPITAATFATVPSTLPGGDRVISGGLPIPAGESRSVNLIDEPSTSVLLKITSADGSDVTVEAVGQ